MFIDKQTQPSIAQAVTASAASTDYVDLQDANRDIGVGEPLRVVITCDESATSGGGSATVTFALQCDEDVAFGSVKTLWASSAIAQATLVAGYKVADFAIPAGVERYNRIYYTVGSGPLTAGKFTVSIVKDSQNFKSYPDAL